MASVCALSSCPPILHAIGKIFWRIFKSGSRNMFYVLCHHEWYETLHRFQMKIMSKGGLWESLIVGRASGIGEMCTILGGFAFSEDNQRLRQWTFVLKMINAKILSRVLHCKCQWLRVHNVQKANLQFVGVMIHHFCDWKMIASFI